MSKRFTILDAMSDPQLFGQQFAGDTWAAWRVALAALFGLSSGDEGLETFKRHTGRSEHPTRPFCEAYLIVGRRGGKSRIMAAVAVYLASFSKLERHLAPGEFGTVLVSATDRRQARTIFRYVEGLIDGSDLLGGMVASRTKESITMVNRVVIEVHTASYRTIRGYTILAALLDELAFWRSDDAANPDTEILNAIRPSMATIPEAMLIGASTPYARSGELWHAYDRHWANDDSDVLVWQADTRSMNPTVPESFIEREYERDALSAAAEYGATFRTDVEALVSPEVVDAAIEPGRFELPPVPGVRYVGFTDPSGGSADSYTLAIAHAQEGRGVLDLVREVRPPFSPEDVTSEFCGLLKMYGLSSVEGDRYAGEWPRERFAKGGITYRTSERTKSEIYLGFVPLLNSGQVELLDLKRLRGQLVGLERRTSRAGRDSIDHGPRGHDDVCNAAAGALVAVLAARGARQLTPDEVRGWELANLDLRQPSFFDRRDRWVFE